MYICEKKRRAAYVYLRKKSAGRQPGEAAFWKGSARGNLFLLKEVPSRPFPRHLHSSSNSFS